MPVFKQNQVFAGRYLLHRLLGEGGFSEVWMAKDQMADDEVVALKIYAAERGMDEWGLRQFKNEFSLTHFLSHPHLLKVNHFDVADGAPYLIMTYCPYGSLGEGLRSGTVYSERQVALVMCQIGAALEEIHRQEPSIIHQDIKPDNILLMQPDCFVLADFGISSRIRTTLSKTAASLQALTLAYAPPERFDRHPTADAASDVFSLGVTLYEMCTNAVPWEGAGGQCLLKGARVPVLAAGFSPALSDILEACMSADRSQRPTATEIRLRGQHYLDTGLWQTARPKRRLPHLNKALVSSLATAAVAFIAIAGISLYDLEVPKAAEKPAEIPTSLVAAGGMDTKTETKEKAPAPAETEDKVEKKPAVAAKRKSSKQEQPAVKAMPVRKPARQAAGKRASVRQRPAQDLAQRSQLQPKQEVLVKAPVMTGETREAPQAIEAQPAPAELKPIATTPQPLPEKAETKAASATRTSSSSSVRSSTASRPSTSNTTITKTKRSWFKAKPSSRTIQKKNPHKKRVRKLRRRFS